MAKALPSQTFKFTAGYCHVIPRFVVITKNGNSNDVLRTKEKNTYPRYMKLAMLVYVAFVIAGVYALIEGQRGAFLAFVFATVPCLFFILRLRGKSNTRVIERSQIRNIQLKKIRSNPTFVILFRDDKGKMKERHLPMKAEDLKEIDKALKLLRSQNLMSGDSINKQTAHELMQDQEIKSAAGSKSPEYRTPEKKAESKKQTTYKRDASGYLKDY